MSRLTLSISLLGRSVQILGRRRYDSCYRLHRDRREMHVYQKKFAQRITSADLMVG